MDDNNKPKQIDLLIFCDIIGCDLIIKKYHNQNRWCVSIENCDILDRKICLIGAHGNAATLNAAMLDYVLQIRGKQIIINAQSQLNRKEFVVPDYLTAPLIT